MLSSDAPTQKASIHDAAISPAPACGPFKNVSQVFGQLLLLKYQVSKKFAQAGSYSAPSPQIGQPALIIRHTAALPHLSRNHGPPVPPKDAVRTRPPVLETGSLPFAIGH